MSKFVYYIIYVVTGLPAVILVFAFTAIYNQCAFINTEENNEQLTEIDLSKKEVVEEKEVLDTEEKK